MTTTNPRPVTPASILAARLREAHELAAGLDDYLESATTKASPALIALEERTRAHGWTAPLEQEMLSGQVEAQFLKMMVHATQARQVLEIGMFTGYSALAMAEALPDGGQLVACELDIGVAAFAQESFDRSKDGGKIDVRVGPAQETLETLARDGRQFDLVFIDADKAGYRDYLETLLTRGLTSEHALIMVDNTLMQGQPWTSAEPTANGEAIAAFNQAVADDERVEQVLVPLRDGITLIRVVG